MKVKFLGTSGYYQTTDRWTNCVAVPELGIVLDGGTGILRLRDNPVIQGDINLLLSHYHHDHLDGIFALHSIAKGKIVNFYGRQVEQSVRGFFSEPFCSTPLREHDFTPVFHEIDNSSFRINNARVQSREFTHKTYPVLGFRIEYQGKTVVYVTDSFEPEDEIDFVQRADLLIHECHYTNADIKKALQEHHGFSRGVAELARDAGVKRLAICHLDPEKRNYSVLEEEIKRIFPNVFIPEDLQEVEV